MEILIIADQVGAIGNYNSAKMQELSCKLFQYSLLDNPQGSLIHALNSLDTSSDSAIQATLEKLGLAGKSAPSTITIGNNTYNLRMSPNSSELCAFQPSVPTISEYKRPVITIQHTVNFTELTNLDEVAMKLARPSDLLLSYLQIKLATQASQAMKKKCLRGRFSVQQIEVLIKEFTRTLVLCNICDNPETELLVKKGTAYLKCTSCGSRTIVNGLDAKLLNKF